MLLVHIVIRTINFVRTRCCCVIMSQNCALMRARLNLILQTSEPAGYVKPKILAYDGRHVGFAIVMRVSYTLLRDRSLFM